MREILLAVALLGAGLAGCIGADEPADASPVADNDSAREADNPSDASSVADDDSAREADNPWQRGLDTSLKTPDVVLTASREDRRSEVVPPGSPRFAAFDEAMERFLEAYDVPAASVAVLHDGQLRYENGYGYVDEDRTEEAGPRTMFRIASITKPMTAAVITKMVEEDRLAWEDPVFCVPPEPKSDCILPIDPHPERPVVDDRLADIELRHLLEHTSGWPAGGACNEPLWSTGAVEAADMLGVETPPPRWRLAQWAMGAELAREPGEASEYCNMGYNVLGLVAEAVTGATLEAVYDAYLFEPLEVAEDVEPGHTPPAKRNDREPFYACDHGRTQSVFDPDEEVCWADGGFDLQGGLGAGGLVATASAVGGVLDKYTYSGEERPEDGDWVESVSGSLPGTAAMGRTRINDVHGEIQVVVLYNTRVGATPYPEDTEWEEIWNALGNPPGQSTAQFFTCARENGLVRPSQCLATTLLREYVTATDTLPAS